MKPNFFIFLICSSFFLHFSFSHFFHFFVFFRFSICFFFFFLFFSAFFSFSFFLSSYFWCSKCDIFFGLNDFLLKFLIFFLFEPSRWGKKKTLRRLLLYFSHFFSKKKFLLLFFFVFLSNMFLLATVSEFNCFLRSRCSMEMWCPDDIGRDSCDWVGPPAWGRACFNSPEWGGGSSPVETEPLQIVLLLFLTTVNEMRSHMSTKHHRLIGMSPR